MIEFVKGSLAWPCRWFAVVAVVGPLLGCGSDLPRDTGGGTITGSIVLNCAKISELTSPWVVVVASYELSVDSIQFQAMYSIPVRPLPAEGIQYQLKGLYSEYEYYIYAVIQDYAYEKWWTPFCVGIYNVLPQKVQISKTAATTGIDLTVGDLP